MTATAADKDLVAALGEARTVIENVVWATMATVGPDGAPRTRIVHPIWDWDTGTGWVTSRATPLVVSHLEHHAGASYSYWSPAHSLAHLDCSTRWVDEEEKQGVWDRCLAIPEPMGFDPSPMFPDGPSGGGFAPIELVPFRIRTHPVADAAAGKPATIWTASGAPLT
jgi:hypothetical protein